MGFKERYQPSNKFLYSVIVILAIVAGVSVYAYNTANPALLGHSGKEVDLVIPNPDGTGNFVSRDLDTFAYDTVTDIKSIKSRLDSLESPQVVSSTTSAQLSGLTAGKKYIISVYGVTANRGTEGATLGNIGVKTCDSSSTLAAATAKYINWHDGQAPQSATFVVTVPSDGCIKGFTDYSVDYIVAYKLG